MNQQHQAANQAAGQGLLERLFALQGHGTTARTEVIAGITTFLTMVYIVFVNPQILSAAGMDTQAVFVTTCLIAGIGSILMGLLANLPIALAPAMGLNAFFAFVVVAGMGYSWQVGMGTIFWGAMGLLILTLLRVRYWLIGNIPLTLRVGITAGIGLLIALLGLHNAGIVVASPATMVTVGNLTSLPCLLGLLGFFLICIFSARGVHSAVLIAIVVTTGLGWLFGDVTFKGFVSMPPSIEPVFGQLDLMGSLDISLAGIIFSFMLVNLFDSSGTLIGVTNRAKLADDKGHFPRMKQALMV
ncbi:MAG: NCS2 family permease, partial [Aeromonas veronii]